VSTENRTNRESSDQHVHAQRRRTADAISTNSLSRAGGTGGACPTGRPRTWPPSPGDVFNAPNHLRICFAVDDNTLDEAIERLTNALTHTPTNTPATQLTTGGDA
jgi:hypothetical protein